LYHIETNDKIWVVGNPTEAKNLIQTGKNFVKCPHLNLLPFFCPQDCLALFVSPASTFTIFRLIKLLLWFAYLRAKRSRKTTTSKSTKIHKREGHLKLLCSLTRQGKNCECHPAHSFLFINILGGYMLLFSSVNQPYASYIFCLINYYTTVTLYLKVFVHYISNW